MINFFRRLKYVSQNLIKKSFSDKYLLTTNCLISISLSSGSIKIKIITSSELRKPLFYFKLAI